MYSHSPTWQQASRLARLERRENQLLDMQGLYASRSGLDEEQERELNQIQAQIEALVEEMQGVG